MNSHTMANDIGVAIKLLMKIAEDANVAATITRLDGNQLEEEDEDALPDDRWHWQFQAGDDVEVDMFIWFDDDEGPYRTTDWYFKRDGEKASSTVRGSQIGFTLSDVYFSLNPTFRSAIVETNGKFEWLIVDSAGERRIEVERDEEKPDQFIVDLWKDSGEEGNSFFGKLDKFNAQLYWDHENSVTRNLGHNVISMQWRSLEEDSFGPLIRGTHAYLPDGKRIQIYYG